METVTSPTGLEAIEYPSSDGKPMGDCPRQIHLMMLLQGNLSAIMQHRPDVFVALDNFWYPVEGHPEIRHAPDVYVAIGRPKGDRGSYKQWEEGNVPLTVAFEIRAPVVSDEEMAARFAFYDQYGIEEYYAYHLGENRLEAFLRRPAGLYRVSSGHGFISPRLGICFDLGGEELAFLGPQGQPFLSFVQHRVELERDRQRTAEDFRCIDLVQEAHLARINTEYRRQLIARMVQLNRKFRRQEASEEDVEEIERLEEEQAASPRVVL